MSIQFSHYRQTRLTRVSRLLKNVFHFIVPLCLVLGLCLLGLMGIAALDKQQKVTEQAAVDLFPTASVLDVQITLDEQDWDTIRYQSRNLFTALQEQRKYGPVEGPYTYVTATVTIGGVDFQEVGLRKKGFVGSQNTDRPSLKIKLNHLDSQAEMNGLTMLTFNNNQQDISLMSQPMGYAMYTRAGSAAPRCGYARITVNGKNLGVYSHVETIRKPLLKREFRDDRGVLYEGTVVDFFEGWGASFERKLGKDRLGRDKIKQLIEVLEQDDLPDVEQAIGELVDLDSFYTFWAVEGLLGFWDGYTANGNNYFIYLNPDTGKFHFLPWGADCAFEKFSKIAFNRRAPLSVKTKGRVAHRLYQVESARQRYARTLMQIMNECWDEEALIAEIERREVMLTPYLAPSQVRSFRVAGVSNFIRTRRAELLAEISDGMPIWTARSDPPPVIPGGPRREEDKNSIWAVARRGDLDAVKKQLARGIDVDARNGEGTTPLAMAALTGEVETARYLISMGADVDAQQNDRNSVLHAAAFLGKVEITKLLLENGVDPNVRNREGDTPLDTASAAWNEELQGIIQLISGMLQIKVDMGAVKAGRPRVVAALRSGGGQLGFSLGRMLAEDIWTAAKIGDIASIKEFLSQGVKVDSRDESGATPLSMAALTGEVETVEYLIGKGADVNARNNENNTSLHGAAFLGQVDVVKLLLEQGADMNARNVRRETPLDNASVPWGQIKEFVRLIAGLLQIEVDMEAVRTGRVEVVTILRGHDAKLDNDPGKNVDVLKEYVAAGKDVNARDELELTLLARSAMAGDVESVKYLLSQDADPNLPNGDENTPLHGAAFFGQVEVVKILVENGADVNAPNDLGETPLDSASPPWKLITQGTVDLVAGIHKVKVEMAAVKAGRPTVIEILRENGGKAGKDLE
jgi:ankyrin repeat protein/spore coat protein CotH